MAAGDNENLFMSGLSKTTAMYASVNGVRKNVRRLYYGQNNKANLIWKNNGLHNYLKHLDTVDASNFLFRKYKPTVSTVVNTFALCDTYAYTPSVSLAMFEANDDEVTAETLGAAATIIVNKSTCSITSIPITLDDVDKTAAYIRLYTLTTPITLSPSKTYLFPGNLVSNNMVQTSVILLDDDTNLKCDYLYTYGWKSSDSTFREADIGTAISQMGWPSKLMGYLSDQNMAWAEINGSVDSDGNYVKGELLL